MPDNCCNPCLLESLNRYIGQTVTIFTTSGGLSGCGFTGTLVAICGCCVKLITDIGASNIKKHPLQHFFKQFSYFPSFPKMCEHISKKQL